MCYVLIYHIWQALKADVFWRRLSVVPRAQGSALHLKEQNPHCGAAQVPLKLVFVRVKVFQTSFQINQNSNS